MFRSTKQRFHTLLVALVVVSSAIAACGGSDDAAEPSSTSTAVPSSTTVVLPPVLEPVSVLIDDRFSVHVATLDGNGPAGAEAVDLDGDGDRDLILNFFGDRGEDPGPIEFPPGGVSILWNEGSAADGGSSLDHWRVEEVIVQSQDIYFPNEALPVDLDGDGDHDLLVGTGFFVCEFNPEIGPCGGLFWLENEPGVPASSWTAHDIVPLGDPGFYHRSVLADVDADGIDDLVTVAEFQDDARAEWFRGTGDPTQPFETPAKVIGSGGGSLPVVHDVDGDGDLDVASGEYFIGLSSYMWFEQTVPPGDGSAAGEWVRHVIDDTTGRTIQLSVIPDLFGDGVDRWIGSNHVNNVTGEPEPLSGIYLVEPPTDPTQPWTPRLISEGIVSEPTVGTAFQAAPGVFSWGDIDDDGDIDLAVSGDGDHRIFWFEQTAPGEFEQHVLIDGFGQAAGGIVEDLDGDGDHEVVFTSYETHEVLILEHQG